MFAQCGGHNFDRKMPLTREVQTDLGEWPFEIT